RESLVTGCSVNPTQQHIDEILDALDMKETVARTGGLDVERDWDDAMSLGELQRIAIARVLLIKPDYAVLDRIETTLETDCIHKVLDMLDRDGTTYVTIARSDHDLSHYDLVLELSGKGPWTVQPAKAADVAV